MSVAGAGGGSINTIITNQLPRMSPFTLQINEIKIEDEVGLRDLGQQLDSRRRRRTAVFIFEALGILG